MGVSETEIWRSPFAPRSHVFASLPLLELHTLGHLGRKRSFRAQEEIFKEEDSAKHVYLVREGRIKIVATSGSGRAHIVRILYPGDMLGMSAVLAKVPYEASAIASTPTVVDEIQANLFLNFLQESSEAMVCVARALCEEYLDIVEHIKLLQVANGIEARVARVLLACASIDECRIPFPLHFTHEEIGNMVGCSRESVTRTFSIFRKHQFIDICDHSVTILQPEHLLAMASLK